MLQIFFPACDFPFKFVCDELNLSFGELMYFLLTRLFFLRFYLFIHERHKERGRNIGRGRSRLPAGSPKCHSIPGLWDHILSWRQTLHHLSHLGALLAYLLNFFFKLLFIYDRHTVRERERGRDTGRGRSRLPAGSPMWDLTPGPRDQGLSQRQTVNRWATQVLLGGDI